jgi:hypothetical protein
VWLAVVAMIIWCLGLIGIFSSYIREDYADWRGLIAGLPFYSMIGYGLASLLLNTTSVRTTPAGVDIVNRRLPGTHSRRFIRADDVVHCYHRFIAVPSKSGSTSYYAAGVETSDGPWIDAMAPVDTDKDAERAAREIAAVLSIGQKSPIPVTSGGIPPRNWNALRVVIAWSAAFVAAMLLGVAIEYTR